MLTPAARCAGPERLPLRDWGGEIGCGRAGDEGVCGAKCLWGQGRWARGSGGVCGHARVGLMLLLAMAAWLVLPALAAQGVTIRVPQDQPTIAAALAAARSGDDILIAPGVYTESIYLTGYATAIRGTRIGAQATILRTAPNATGFAQPVIQGGASSATANERINEVTIEDIDFIPDPATTNGQAVASDRGNLRFVSCRFVGHKLPGSESAIVAKIGGSLTLENCEFIGNVVGLRCAVVSQSQSSSYKGDLVVHNCRFEGNVATDGARGRVIVASGRRALISESLIVRNGKINGPMVATEMTGGEKHTVNTTIADNVSGSESVIRYLGTTLNTAPCIIANSIIWGNQSTSTPPVIAAYSSALPAVTYSVVQGGYAGLHNLAVDPRFVDPIAGDYRLRSDSPCIDAGNNTVVEIGDSLDIDASPRFADVLSVPDNGVPSAAFPRAVIDIGPYEFVAPETCTADANHSGSVTADDLFIFLDQWFAQMGTPCP